MKRLRGGWVKSEKRELTMSFDIENNSFSVAQVKVERKSGGRRRSEQKVFHFSLAHDTWMEAEDGENNGTSRRLTRDIYFSGPI